MVNTSSGNGGVSPLRGTPQYAVTKAAVVTLTECLYAQLQDAGSTVGASVLFPGPNMLRTGIFSSWRVRPAELAKERPRQTPYPTIEDIEAQMAAAGIEVHYTEPAEVADQVVRGVQAGRFWIMAPSAVHRRPDPGPGRLDARAHQPHLPAGGPRVTTPIERGRIAHVNNYMVISADCHAGLPNEQYRDWLDPEFRDAFDQQLAARAAMEAELAERGLRNPNSPRSGSRRTPKASRADGTPTDATRSSTPTGSSVRSSSPTPTR